MPRARGHVHVVGYFWKHDCTAHKKRNIRLPHRGCVSLRVGGVLEHIYKYHYKLANIRYGSGSGSRSDSRTINGSSSSTGRENR
jgi:hypothetical protein